MLLGAGSDLKDIFLELWSEQLNKLTDEPTEDLLIEEGLSSKEVSSPSSIA